MTVQYILFSRAIRFFSRKGDMPRPFLRDIPRFYICVPLYFFSRDIAFVRESGTKIKQTERRIIDVPAAIQSRNRELLSVLPSHSQRLSSFFQSNPKSNSSDIQDTASPDIFKYSYALLPLVCKDWTIYFYRVKRFLHN